MVTRAWRLLSAVCAAVALSTAAGQALAADKPNSQPAPSSSKTTTPAAAAPVAPASSASKPATSETPLAEQARQFLAAAKAKLEEERQDKALKEQAAKAKLEEARRAQVAKDEAARRAKTAKEQADQRQRAQKMAVDLARQKTKGRRAAAPPAGVDQVRIARDRQVKALYEKGLLFYRQGYNQEAIDAWQKMVLLDPTHPDVKTAERLITRAELKQLEQRAKASAAAAPGMHDMMVSELTKMLTDKRIEQDTVIKYARSAMQDRNYDMAIELLYRVLQQDPTHRQAQALIEQARMAKLKQDEDRIEGHLKIDDQQMLNDVLHAEQLPPDESTKKPQAKPIGGPMPTGPDITKKLQEPISFDFQQVGLSDVLDFIADSANVSIIPSPHIGLKERQVSLHVDKLPLEQALKYLAKSQELAYRIEDGVILIATPDEFANEPLETRVFFLRSGLGPFALQNAAVSPNPSLQMDSLKDLIEQNITQPSGSKFVVDERSGSLIVTNTSDNLRKIEQLLSQLDTIPVQVLIEARFIEVTMTELEQLSFENVLTGDFPLQRKTDHDGTRGAAHQIASGGGIKFPTVARKSEALNITLQGVLTGTQFESVLHMLEEKQNSKTLSAPRVTTLNNQAATIKVVDEFRYPTRYEVSLVQFDINGDGDFDDAGETEFVNVPQDFQKRDVGILLNVTPSVGKDLKTITLVLAPEVSAFSQFRDLGGGVSVPEFTSSQLMTTVAMQDGQTVVLGGLMKDTVTTTNTKVPVLGDLPVVGALFRQHQESGTRKNLLIFVTARILAPRGPTT